jgi:predicted nucleic acid-binding protein
MIVVSDTTPLRYLAVVGGLDWLPVIFGEVICPVEVIEECLHPGAPPFLREWTASAPTWLRIAAASQEVKLPKIPFRLDAGETAALALANGLGADLLLMDERRGRDAAARLGLAVTGTLGVLVEASRLGLVNFEVVLAQLTSTTNFRASEAVIALARARLSGLKDEGTSG